MRYYSLISALMITLVTLLPGCTPKQTGILTAKDVICESPRPQICTMDYVPVCAVMKNGSQKTMSNACTACSLKEVTHYRPGPCKATD